MAIEAAALSPLAETEIEVRGWLVEAEFEPPTVKFKVVAVVQVDPEFIDFQIFPLLCVAIRTVPESFIETEFQAPALLELVLFHVLPESVDNHKFPVDDETELVSDARIIFPFFEVAIAVQL